MKDLQVPAPKWSRMLGAMAWIGTTAQIGFVQEHPSKQLAKPWVNLLPEQLLPQHWDRSKPVLPSSNGEWGSLDPAELG